MKKLKVLTVVGTRPEIIRLSRIITKLNSNRSIEHILVHTGQNYNYELNEIFFKELKLDKPDYIIKSKDENTIKTIGIILSEIDIILEKEKPDAFLILGDTNSGLTAIAAKKRSIPIFHMEAGNRCFDERVPEEINRKIIDHIADINLPYSSIGREYLLKENIAADRIIKTGSPLFEVLNHYKNDIDNSTILERLNLKKDAYFLVSAHRAENIKNEVNFKQLLDTLEELAKKYSLPIIVSTHPRTRKRLNEGNYNLHSNINFLEPLGFFDYNSLQMSALMVLSDSGTISEEASILNFKAINIREAHERPEAMEETAVIMTGLQINSVVRAIETMKDEKLGHTNRNVADYQVPNVSEKIVRILLSYTDYVNKNVWKK